MEQLFETEKPNQVWVTDITCIRTHEGWLYLAAVLDLFSRQAVELATLGWVAWFNNHRLLEPIGYIPQAETDARYYRVQSTAPEPEFA